MVNVTYGITVCNEIKEITTLVNFLHPRIQSDDEILIQYDEGGVTDDVMGYLRIINDLPDSVWYLVIIVFTATFSTKMTDKVLNRNKKK